MTEPTPTVYSYYSPEVENVVYKALNGLNVGRLDSVRIHETLRQNIDPGLDDLHLPLMEKYEAFARSEGVIGLDAFENKYFTNGSSEAIFHLLARANLTHMPVYQFDGEYQGYAAFGKSIELGIETIDPDELGKVRPGIVIMSNPASKDGNIVNLNLLTTILRRHQVILDLAYMGMTRKPLNVDLTQPGIIAVVGSLSKSFGLYYYRIGFCYTHESVDSLYGNKWFKNALSIKIGEAVLDAFDPKKLLAFKDKYFGLQDEVVCKLNDLYNLDNRLMGASERRAKASDVWMLAHAPLRESDPADLRPFKRGGENYRFCLTPYYTPWSSHET